MSIRYHRIFMALIIAVLIAIIPSAGVRADVTMLVSDGSASASIVVGADADELEKLVAEELRIYIEKISDVKLSIVNSQAQGKGPR